MATAPARAGYLRSLVQRAHVPLVRRPSAATNEVHAYKSALQSFQAQDGPVVTPRTPIVTDQATVPLGNSAAAVVHTRKMPVELRTQTAPHKLPNVGSTIAGAIKKAAEAISVRPAAPPQAEDIRRAERHDLPERHDEAKPATTTAPPRTIERDDRSEQSTPARASTVQQQEVEQIVEQVTQEHLVIAASEPGGLAGGARPQAPQMHVHWGDAAADVPASTRLAVEREVIARAREELRRRGLAGNTMQTHAPSTVDIRIDSVTVKLEQSPAQTVALPAPSASSDGAATMFFARNLSRL